MPRPTTVAKWLGLAYAAGWTAFIFANADAWDVVALGLLFLPWEVGPAAAAAMLVKASRTAAGAWAFLLLEAALVVSTVALVSDIWLRPAAWGSVGGPVTIAYILPFRQYLCVGVFLGIALLSGWRAGDSWLRDRERRSLDSFP